MTPVDLVAEALASATEGTCRMVRHDARETYGAPRFLTVADCEPDSVPRDHLCIAEDADDLADADDRASSTSRMNPFSGKPHTYPARIVYARRDVMLAAMLDLAARVVAERERAQRLRKGLDDTLYAIMENTLRGEGEPAGAVCKRAIEADGEVPRG